MQRCLDLARMGFRTAAPNPMVGSVIVHNGRIIGEGYHHQCGGPHAEVEAVRSVKERHLLPEATLYVNLEPCAHHGRTPPCSDMIVRERIKRVVVGCIDSFSEVAGKGIERMQKAGVEVLVGVLEKESRWLNRRFFTYHEQKRPYVILKWAQTRDGFIDALRSPNNVHAAWITNEISRSLVHKWRTEEQSVMVGTRTAELDNPQLNIRAWHGQSPMRITIDRDLSLSPRLHLFDGSQPTVVFTEKVKASKPGLEFVQVDFSSGLLAQIMTALYLREVLSVVVEGGEIMLSSFIEADLWDEALVFRGDKFFVEGTPAPKLVQKPVEKLHLKESSLYYYIRTE